MTVDEAIKRSGTRNILAKSSTKETQRMIQPNEEVLYAINANVIVKSTNTLISLIKSKTNGVFCITNKRILFCSSILGTLKKKQMNIKDIVSIEENVDGITKMGQMEIKGITEIFIIDIYKLKLVDEIKECIYKVQNEEK